MAIRNVIDFDNPKFHKTSRAITSFDEKLAGLLDDMLDTLRHVGGYGCAGVHVGVLKRVVVIDGENGLIELINPVVAQTSEATQVVTEGSISAKAPQGDVIRPLSVVVSGFDRQGNPIEVTGEGFLSATLCHEIDHLDGILFSDKII